MHQDYNDIRSLIPFPPKWFDEVAVPRYCDFSPQAVTDIYADEAALVEIACQMCEHRFYVAFSRNRGDGWNVSSMLWQQIEKQAIDYLDPPNIGCCPSGPTMTSNSLRVLEYWSRLNTSRDWRRDARFEIGLSE